MATNVRQLAESQLSQTLGGVFGIPIILKAPDGSTIDTDAITGGTLKGQVNYETIVLNPETGEEIAVNKPNVAIRRASLSRVPQSDENWLVRIPVSPRAGAAIEDFVITPTEAPRGGATIGFIRLYLTRAEQI